MTARYYKGREVLKEYKQGRLVYEKQSSIPDYLCFTALEAGQFTLTIPAAVTATYLSYVEWSKDGRTWNHTDNTSEAVTIDVQVAQGEKVYWRGSGTRYATNTTTYCNFSSEGNFNASGTLKSLLFAENFVAHVDGNWTSTYNYALSGLFRGCTTLIDASGMTLPSGHLAVAMLLGLFRDCTNLIKGADLPATGVNGSTYYWVYYNCKALATLPAIGCTNITNLDNGVANYAFFYAFWNCIAMEGDVVLNLTQCKGKQIFDGCFRGSKVKSADISIDTFNLQGSTFRDAFYACATLNHVRCTLNPSSSLITSTDFNNWLSDVSSTGTFIQAEGVTWPRGASGIPTGWVDIEKRTMPSGYKQLLQVTSNGTAYIQLSFGFEETDEVAATFSVDNTQSNDKYIVSSQTWNSNNNRYGLGQHLANHYYTPAFGGVSTGQTCLTPLTANNGELHNWTYASHLFTLVDLSLSRNVSSITFGGVTTNLRLFYGMAPNNTKGAISSYKHIKGSTTACDFVAAIRESDDTAGLYDLANEEFVTCNGLTAGEEI